MVAPPKTALFPREYALSANNGDAEKRYTPKPGLTRSIRDPRGFKKRYDPKPGLSQTAGCVQGNPWESDLPKVTIPYARIGKNAMRDAGKTGILHRLPGKLCPKRLQNTDELSTGQGRGASGATGDAPKTL